MNATDHTPVSWGPYDRITCRCGERFEGQTSQQAIEAHIQAAPTGMGIGQAIRLVAQHALATAARDENAIDWESYPEIGEHAWFRIIDRLDDIAPFPDADEYATAYALLAARADDAA
jgi:uncharacterized protein YoaH (UPF0181 family)